MDCSLPSPCVHGILQTRILEWVAISFSSASSRPRDWTHIFCVCCLGRWILYHLHHLGSPGPLGCQLKLPPLCLHVFRGRQCSFREGRQLGAVCASSLPAGFLCNVLLEEWRQNYSETSDFPAVGCSAMTKDSLSPDWWWGKNYTLQRGCWDHLEFVCNQSQII